MKRMIWLLPVLLLVGCSDTQEAAARIKEKVAQTGEKESTALMQTLGGNLQAAMQQGGPVHAMDFCAGQANVLTQQVSDHAGEGIRVKRVSLKYRNPANQPDGIDAKVLEMFETNQANGETLAPHIEKTGEGYRYYTPLVIPENKPCLRCHGSDIAPEVAQKIQTLYPTDTATGYETGDVRGAIRVDIAKSAL